MTDRRALVLVSGRPAEMPDGDSLHGADPAGSAAAAQAAAIAASAPVAHVGAGGTAHAAATTSTAGFLSATDKTKLDGIAAGAEVNVNADWNATSGKAQILNKPTTMTPSAHTHAQSDVTDLTTDLAAKVGKTGSQTMEGPLILGTDPGGSEKLRVGGPAAIKSTGGGTTLRLISDATGGPHLEIDATAATNGRRWHIGDGVSAASGTLIIYDYTDSAIRLSIGATGTVVVTGDLVLGTDPGGSEKLRVGGSINLATGGGVKVNGTQVLGAQGAAVADATGGSTVDAEARTAINTLLARLRTHGLIAT